MALALQSRYRVRRYTAAGSRIPGQMTSNGQLAGHAACARRGKEQAVTVDDFRQIALGFVEATESAHMGRPDFRVRNKIFATIWPEEGWGMVKLTPDQQATFVRAEPDVFVPVKGGWGRKGYARSAGIRQSNKRGERAANGLAKRRAPVPCPDHTGPGYPEAQGGARRSARACLRTTLLTSQAEPGGCYRKTTRWNPGPRNP